MNCFWREGRRNQTRLYYKYMNIGLLVLLFCLYTLVCTELLSVLCVSIASSSLVRARKKEWKMSLEKCRGQTKKGLVSLFRFSYLCLEFTPSFSALSPCLSCIIFKVHLKYQGLCEAISDSPIWLVGFQILSPLQTGTISLIFLSSVAPRTVPCKL